MTDTCTGSVVTREELYNLVWAEPMTKVAPRFGLSDVGLGKVCQRYSIPRPPVGYWAKKQFGKEPARTPLPPLDVDERQTIQFTEQEKPKPADRPIGSERVSDAQLKRLLQLEELPKNRIVVLDTPTRFHAIVRETRDAFSREYTDRQGLYSPSWSGNGARLDISVAKESRPRALRLMDALIKAFEQRGHKVVVEGSEYRRAVFFAILGEKFWFRLREKTKMIRIPEPDRKSLFDNRVRYEPTGLFELQLSRESTGTPLRTWKDRPNSTLEQHLNAVMMELIVGVEQERIWRRQREEDERRRRELEALRWQQEVQRRKEEEKIKALDQMLHNWEHATRIRQFIADVRLTLEDRNGPIEESGELSAWMTWALAHADAIDPLRAQNKPSNAQVSNDWNRPNQPR